MHYLLAITWWKNSRAEPNNFMAAFVSRFVLKHSRKIGCILRAPGLRTVTRYVSHRVLPPDDLLWVQVRGGPGKGLWLKLRPRTGGDVYNGRTEPILQQVLLRHLHKGMVFYDLGANLGLFSLIAARLVGNDGRVFAFEADNEVAGRLQNHIDKNGFTNVRLVQRAVWSSSGSVAFRHADPLNSPDLGCGTVVQTTAEPNTTSVASISLDDFVKAEAKPHLIKCDVEGAETQVFEGATKLLTEHRPSIICEVHSTDNRIRLDALLRGLRYRLEWLTETHFLAVPIETPVSS